MLTLEKVHALGVQVRIKTLNPIPGRPPVPSPFGAYSQPNRQCLEPRLPRPLVRPRRHATTKALPVVEPEFMPDHWRRRGPRDDSAFLPMQRHVRRETHGTASLFLIPCRGAGGHLLRSPTRLLLHGLVRLAVAAAAKPRKYNNILWGRLALVHRTLGGSSSPRNTVASVLVCTWRRMHTLWTQQDTSPELPAQTARVPLDIFELLDGHTVCPRRHAISQRALHCLDGRRARVFLRTLPAFGRCRTVRTDESSQCRHLGHV